MGLLRTSKPNGEKGQIEPWEDTEGTKELEENVECVRRTFLARDTSQKKIGNLRKSGRSG
jgi:hypothetical protein